MTLPKPIIGWRGARTPACRVGNPAEARVSSRVSTRRARVRAPHRALIVAALAAAALAAQQKNYKDNGEYEMYTAVSNDFKTNNFTKAIADLDAWKQKYAASDFAGDRNLLYVQAYAGAKQPAKAVDAAAGLVGRDLDSAANTVKLLFTTVVSIQQVADPTAEQFATAQKAARQLLTFDKKPEGLTDDAWAQARGQLQTAAKGALLYMALVPGTLAMQNTDCAAAETAFAKALGDYPDSAQAAWDLGLAQICLYKTQPDKASPALYSLARAVAVDPNKTAAFEDYLQKAYDRYHGPDAEGLKQLKELAAKSPLPPDGFKIKSVAEIAQEKQAEFEKSNPQLALWMKIKGALADTNGEHYFTSSLKDTDVPQLRGVLVEAKPACHPKELLVAVPLPDAPQPLQPEITLKLDKPLPGKVESNTEFHWQGVPSAFAAAPFMLTMETETAKIEGLKTKPCGVTAKKGGVKKTN